MGHGMTSRISEAMIGHRWAIVGGYVNWVAANVCEDRPSPDRCIQDDEVLTQHTWQDGDFIDEPRETEEELSMLRGDISIADACAYRSRMSKISAAKIAKAGRRQTTAGRIRAAGLVVVHTPGRKTDGIHVSIIWPPDDPVNKRVTPWPADVRRAFAACFNESSRGE